MGEQGEKVEGKNKEEEMARVANRSGYSRWNICGSGTRSDVLPHPIIGSD